MNPMWSWIISGIGISALLLTSRGVVWGWLVAIGNQALWITYAVVTRQWGFIPASLLYVLVFALNYRRAAR
jgi:hypothetical protein